MLIAGRIYLVQLGELKTETWVEGLAAYLQRLAEGAQTLAADELAPGWLTAADFRTQVRIFNLLAADPAAAPNLRAMRRSFSPCAWTSIPILKPLPRPPAWPIPPTCPTAGSTPVCSSSSSPIPAPARL